MQHGMFSTAVNTIELSVTLLSFKLTLLILILVLFVECLVRTVGLVENIRRLV